MQLYAGVGYTCLLPVYCCRAHDCADFTCKESHHVLLGVISAVALASDQFVHSEHPLRQISNGWPADLSFMYSFLQLSIDIPFPQLSSYKVLLDSPKMVRQVSMQIEAAALDRIMKALDQNQPARSVELSDEEAAAIRPLYLLTMKPMIYAANVAEDELADLGAANKHVQAMRNKIAKDGCELIIVSAQVRRQNIRTDCTWGLCMLIALMHPLRRCLLA